jgi:tripartite-type tricarboxylate transporter receptor subunit TctC
MNMRRRNFLQLTGSALALLAKPSRAWSQGYPTRPLRWIVGFSAGGAADIIARLVAEPLAIRLGQQVVVENKPGAGSTLSVQTLLNAPPDGYTLLLVGSSTVLNALLHKSGPSTFLDEIEPVAGLVVSAFVIVTHLSLPITTLSGLIEFAKANPGELRVGSYGIGTQSHLAVELFAKDLGIEVVHVPYRGGAPMIKDLLGQQIQVAFDTTASALPHVRSGALRALAVTASGRLKEALPEVPAVAEAVPGYEVVAWTGIGIRKGAPSHVLQKLNLAVNAVLAEQDVRQRFADFAIVPTPYDLDEARSLWATEIDRMLKLMPSVGIRLE